MDISKLHEQYLCIHDVCPNADMYCKVIGSSLMSIFTVDMHKIYGSAFVHGSVYIQGRK
jgi:hypothetical protein